MASYNKSFHEHLYEVLDPGSNKQQTNLCQKPQENQGKAMKSK